MVDSLKSYTLLGDPSMRLPAAAFTEAAPAPAPPAPVSSDDDSGGGLFGCGRIDTDRGDGKGPGTGLGALAEFAMMLAMIFATRRLSIRAMRLSRSRA
jgi:hypothetical protein